MVIPATLLVLVTLVIPATLIYSEWRNFNNTIEKAKTACATSGFDVQDHFVDVNKMVEIGSGKE